MKGRSESTTLRLLGMGGGKKARTAGHWLPFGACMEWQEASVGVPAGDVGAAPRNLS